MTKLAEQAERVTEGNGSEVSLETEAQGPVAEVVLRSHKVGFGRTEDRKDIVFLTDVEVGQKLYAAPQPVKQEPVAWMSPNKERLEFSRKDTVYGSHTIPLYAAPVRTKDLTDDEILACGGMDGADDWVFEFARAVIAAYKEKQK